MSSTEEKLFELKCELTDWQALALAQFVKRAGYYDFRRCAVNEEEAYEMMHACDQVRDGLARIGYRPR